MMFDWMTSNFLYLCSLLVDFVSPFNRPFFFRKTLDGFDFGLNVGVLYTDIFICSYPTLCILLLYLDISLRFHFTYSSVRKKKKTNIETEMHI